MEIAPQRTIGAAAAEIGIAVGTLRLYERLGLIVPLRDTSGRRVYGDAEIKAARRVRDQRLAARGSGLRSFGSTEAHVK